MKVEDEEIKYYQPRFARWIKSNKWDDIAEKLSDTKELCLEGSSYGI